MTVAIGIETPTTPKPSHAVPLLQNKTNKRWPPMANRNTLPYKLTVISKEKLAREATAPDPCLRRCVAHFRLHCGSVEWTEKEMKSRISSFEFEETDEEDEDEGPEQRKLEQPPQQPKETLVQINITETTPESDAASSLASPPPSPQLSPDNGLFEQGRQCIEMASKNICCISVSPLAG